MKLQMIALVILLGIAGRGEAGFYTGSEVLSNCQGSNEGGRSLCALYLGAIVDATEIWAGAGLMPRLICMPAETSTDRLREIFVAYANQNPEELHEVASATVIAALIGAFPCE